MPIMVRKKGKGTNIAFDVLGVPANLKKRRRSKRKAWIDKKLTSEETSRVK